MQCAFERYHIRRAESEERRAIFLFATRSSPSAFRLGAWVETPCLFGWHTLSCEVALALARGRVLGRLAPVVFDATPFDDDTIEPVPAALPVPTLGGTWGVGFDPGPGFLGRQFAVTLWASGARVGSEGATTRAGLEPCFRLDGHGALMVKARIVWNVVEPAAEQRRATAPLAIGKGRFIEAVVDEEVAEPRAAVLACSCVEFAIHASEHTV